MTYLLLVTVALSISYFPIGLLQHYFFHNSNPAALKNRWPLSLFIIVIISLAVYAISFSIPDEELRNRIIHSIGGGFLAYMVSFLAAKDTNLIISKTNFIIFTFMLVTNLGVFNEVVEYVLQNYFDFTAAPHINDTWLDLISNIAGTIIAALCFTPFLNNKSR